jgi:FMN phosphatase YigB (HAD superfamily)
VEKTIVSYSQNTIDRLRVKTVDAADLLVSNSKRNDHPIVAIFDVDNCLYSPNTQNEARGHQGFMEFLEGEFKLNRTNALHLRELLWRLSDGSTPGGLHRIASGVYEGGTLALEQLYQNGEQNDSFPLFAEDFLDLARRPAQKNILGANTLVDRFNAVAFAYDPSHPEGNYPGIKPDPKLRDALIQLRDAGVKILTHSNTSAEPVEKILQALDVLHDPEGKPIFEGIGGVDTAGFVPKPSTQSYTNLCAHFGYDVAKYGGCFLFVDDKSHNNAGAYRAGILTTIGFQSIEPSYNDNYNTITTSQPELYLTLQHLAEAITHHNVR